MAPALVDAFAAFDASARALARGGAASMRLFRPAGPAEGAYGPTPRLPVVGTLDAEAHRLTVDGAAVAITFVEVAVEPLPWGPPNAPFDRALARVSLAGPSGDAGWIAGELLAEDEPAARARAAALASTLASALGVEARGLPEGDAPAPSENTEALLPPDAGARFALSFEGEHAVLRDLVRRGPRETAALYVGLSLLLLALAGYAWWAFAGEVQGARSIGGLLGLGAVSLVLTVGAYAMAEVARFAYAYRGTSEAVAWFCDDKVVISPWVSRTGAVDPQPEGRYGAAIKIAEVDGVRVETRGAEHGVMLTTAHGPIDVLVTPSAETAAFWARVVERCLAGVASPQKRATAAMRARQRSEATG